MTFRALLRRAGVSRVWLATATGYSRSAVDTWCAGTVVEPDAVTQWLWRRIDDPPPRLRQGRTGER